MKKSLQELTEEELDAHLGINKYGDFTLTDAVRPSYNLEVIPQQGFKKSYYQDEEILIPVIIISASKEILFDLFMDLVDLLGNKRLGVALETSHYSEDGTHIDFYNLGMDAIALKSSLYDFEESLVEDGCAGIAIMNRKKQIEVQFDEHKILYFYNWLSIPLKIITLMKKYNISELPYMKMISDAEHMHNSSNSLQEEFEKLKSALNVNQEY